MLTIVLGTLVAIQFVGYRIIYLQESNRITESTSAIVRDVAKAMNEARTSLKTFAAMHYDDSVTGSFNAKYADFLLADNPAIGSIGRVMRESDDSLSITHVQSKNEDMQLIVGWDLNQYAVISSILPTAVASNKMAAVVTPESWPDSSDFLFLQPGYQYSVGSSPYDIMEHAFSGGYWSTFSFDGVMNGFYADPATATVELQVNISETTGVDQAIPGVGETGSATVFNRHFTSNRVAWFSFLFAPLESSQTYHLGKASFIVSVNGQPAASSLAVLVGALATGFTSSIFLVCFAIVFLRRRSNHEKMQASDALTQERAKAARTLNSITESVIALDTNFNVTYMNDAGISVLGLDSDTVVGSSVNEVTKLYDVENNGALFNLTEALQALNNGEGAELDVMLYDKNNVSQSMQLSMTNSTDSPSESGRYTLVLRDVSAERALTRELEYQANHDSLTGVWNRFYFEKRLKVLVDSTRRQPITHALVYMDLDQFKIVNDTCGHTAGDRLLRELTRNLSAVLRPGDVLARLGGDEFGLLVINASHEDAVQVAERIFGFFQNSVFYHEGKAFPVRASIGFVPINGNSGSLEDVLSAADIACYSAKDSGRNSLNVYSEENAHIAQRHQDMNWLPRLQKALKDDHFQLLVQAVADTQTKHIEHYEFLLRLCRSDGSVVTPMQFIQAAERYDLMKDIDRWVIRAATQEIAKHHAALGGHCSYSINLSGQSAADASLLPFIEECIAHADIPASCIWFEITETAAITHFQVAVELFQQLRAMGSKVALDDFGSGLSSFGYLKNLPVDVIKIDGQFVKNLEHDSIDREMVAAIHRVAQAMGIVSVAEFVESEKSLNQLADIGVDLAQGYHIAHPCSLQEAIANYSANKKRDDKDSGLSSAA